ncbi:MAG: flagellar basal-body MS-ring/collar protein FliF [Legionellales bacterium]
MNYFQPILSWFLDLPQKRKLSLSLLLGLIILSTSLLGWWVLSPTYAVLFSHLDDQDASHILGQLEQANIPYQLNNNGQDILIAKNLIPKTRLKIMSEGVELKGSVGFELFDKSDFGMTDFSQKINYQRALQGELERTIASLDEVLKARVHLMLPESHLFEKEQSRPKAAVTLHLKRELNPKQVRSIQQLITASVAHLRLKDVVVLDHMGNTLSKTEEDSSSSHLSTKKSIEHYLNEKVAQMLHPIFPKEKIMVKIDVSLNYDELQRELIKPQSKGQITHEKEIKNTLPDKAEKKQLSQHLTIEKSYQFGSEKEQFKRARGTIDRLSISVVLPKNISEQTRAQVQRLVENGVGFNKQRGDVISVEALINTPVKSRIPTIPVLIASMPVTPLTTYIPLFLLIFLVTGTTASLVIRHLQKKRRQLLLVELNQWLVHHES